MAALTARLLIISITRAQFPSAPPHPAPAPCADPIFATLPARVFLQSRTSRACRTFPAGVGNFQSIPAHPYPTHLLTREYPPQFLHQVRS